MVIIVVCVIMFACIGLFIGLAAGVDSYYYDDSFEFGFLGSLVGAFVGLLIGAALTGLTSSSDATVRSDLRAEGYSVAYASAPSGGTNYNDVLTPFSKRHASQGDDGVAVVNVTVGGNTCKLRYGVWRNSGAKHYVLVKDSGELVGSPASCPGLDPNLNLYIQPTA